MVRKILNEEGTNNLQIACLNSRKQRLQLSQLQQFGDRVVRRHRRAAAAAADRISASRRRRFRDVFTSCCTPST